MNERMIPIARSDSGPGFPATWSGMRGNPPTCSHPPAARCRADQIASAYSAPLKVTLDLVPVLGGQDFRRCQQRNLLTTGNHGERGIDRNGCFARATVSLQKTVHRLRPGEVRTELSYRLVLCCRQRERKPLAHAAAGRTVTLQRCALLVCE